jgi:predicted DNA-binding transcriptional regulator YafY
MDNKYEKNLRDYLMPGVEPKKMALWRIQQILFERTDADHPLKQEDIARILEIEYGIELERKAIGRHIADLKDAGVDIVQCREGSYIASRDFDDSELRLLIDAVLQSKYISQNHSKDLIEKLSKLSNKHFKSHINHVHSVGDWSKTENKDVFYNIEIIDEAITNGKRIKYTYNLYGVDCKLHERKEHTVSPYQLILHNQRYYLMGLNHRWGDMSHHRLDKITNIEILDDVATPLRSLDGYKRGIDYKKLSSTMPYLYTDEPERVTFVADEFVVDQIVDWFGESVYMKDIGDKKVQVEVKVSPIAMEYWALQFSKFVEVKSPMHLRNKIKDALENAVSKYN